MRECECWGGGGGGVGWGEHKGREEEEDEEETMAVDAMKIAALLGSVFVVWCFHSPHPFPNVLQVQKRKES